MDGNTTVFYVGWRGIPAGHGQDSIMVQATPGTEIKSAMRRPFGFTVIEKAIITRGECPECGRVETLHAGVCDGCRVGDEAGS